MPCESSRLYIHLERRLAVLLPLPLTVLRWLELPTASENAEAVGNSRHLYRANYRGCGFGAASCLSKIKWTPLHTLPSPLSNPSLLSQTLSTPPSLPNHRRHLHHPSVTRDDDGSGGGAEAAVRGPTWPSGSRGCCGAWSHFFVFFPYFRCGSISNRLYKLILRGMLISDRL